MLQNLKDVVTSFSKVKFIKIQKRYRHGVNPFSYFFKIWVLKKGVLSHVSGAQVVEWFYHATWALMVVGSNPAFVLEISSP